MPANTNSSNCLLYKLAVTAVCLCMAISMTVLDGRRESCSSKTNSSNCLLYKYAVTAVCLWAILPIQAAETVSSYCLQMLLSAYLPKLFATYLTNDIFCIPYTWYFLYTLHMLFAAYLTNTVWCIPYKWCILLFQFDIAYTTKKIKLQTWQDLLHFDLTWMARYIVCSYIAYKWR